MYHPTHHGAMSGHTRLPVLAIPHGAGPCFFMDWPSPSGIDIWGALRSYLQQTGQAVASGAKSILVVSGHWSESKPTVLSAAKHSLFFDYYGFPPSTYQLAYPASGDPALASRVRALLADAGITSAEERSRGLDHGVFVPFLVMFPDAPIPIVQLSLRADMDAKAHLAIGKALVPLRDEGVLIIGSGDSYHNIKDSIAGTGDAFSKSFDAWLATAMLDPDPQRRNTKLATWGEAPSARKSHPTPEHLLPYHVAAGAAADDIGRLAFAGNIMGTAHSGYQFG